MVDGHDLSGLDVPDELGSDHAESAGLGTYDIAVSEPSDGQGPETVLVTDGVDSAAGHHQKRESPFYHVQGFHYRVDSRAVPLGRLLLDEVGENLAVGCGLEEAAAVLEVFSQLGRVDDVAVVHQGEIPAVVLEEKRLDVFDAASAVC